MHNQNVDFVCELPAEGAWHTISEHAVLNHLNGVCSVQPKWTLIVKDVFDPNNVVCAFLPFCR